MSKLAAGDLMSVEQYARERAACGAQVLRHKAERQVAVGPNATWCFEDRLTVQYQVQEMLRAERIFEPQGIQDELEAYNPLIPDGGNWKVTLLIEFAQPVERVQALASLRGIEDRCWVQVAGHERVFAIADSDTRVLVLTCKLHAGEFIEAWQLGADEYVTKPVDPFALVEKLNALLTIPVVQLQEEREAKLEKAVLLARLESSFGKSPSWGSSIRSRL